MLRSLTLALAITCFGATTTAAQTPASQTHNADVALQLLQQLDEMEAQLMMVTNEKEQLAFELRHAKNRIAELEEQVKTQTASAPEKIELNTNPDPIILTDGDPKPENTADNVDFDTAHNLLLAGDFSGADTAFKTYININPDTPKTAEAHYWIGEIAYAQSQHADAAGAYVQALKLKLNTDKAPDAIVKLASSLRHIDKRTEACTTLNAYNASFKSAPEAIKQKAQHERNKLACE